MIGRTLGNYRIVEALGSGGMGTVYKAIDLFLDRPVAIKALSPELAHNPELLERFRAEARAQANLSHTNIATLYTLLVDGGEAFMVMEYVEGESIAQMIGRRGLLPCHEVIPIFKQALLGIGYAHRMGIVHRDIKPANLMVNRSGIVKVMDFGIAKVVGSRGLTRTGVQVGTAWYMSPEQVMNKGVDTRSDIYSLGVTLYEMLTANVPFQADSEFQILSDHVHTPPPPLSRFYAYLPKGVENIVLKALAKNPDERFQTVEEFGSALEHPEAFEPGAEPHRPPPLAATYVQPPTGPVAAPPTGVAPRPAQVTPPPAPGTYWPVPPPQTVAPIPPARPSFLTTPAGILLLGGALVVALAGAWFAVRPNPAPQPTPVSDRATVQSAMPKEEHVITPGAETVAPGPELRIVKFRSDSAQVAPGQKAHLVWSVEGASEVTISPAVGKVDANGNAEITVQRTTEFTLVARKASGEVTRSTAVVQVADAPKAQTAASSTPVPVPAVPVPTPAQPVPPTTAPVAPVRPGITFDAEPREIQPGGAAMLRWSLTNAQSAAIEPEPGALQQAAGQHRVTPPATTTYTLAARSRDGTTATATATVQVAAPVPVAPPPPVTSARPGPAGAAGTPIRVMHDHGGALVNGSWPGCWGVLQVNGGQLHYAVMGSSDGRMDNFQLPLSAIQEVKMNRLPIRGQQVFHLRLNGRNLNFIPMGVAAAQAVLEIERHTQGR